MASTYPIRFAAQMREHLRALRKKQGLTQAQLGAQLGVSQARIAEIEANPGLVSFEQLLQLLSHLGGSMALETETRYPASGVWSQSPEFKAPSFVAEDVDHIEPRRVKPSPTGSSSEKSRSEAKIVAAPYYFNKKKGSW